MVPLNQYFHLAPDSIYQLTVGILTVTLLGEGRNFQLFKMNVSRSKPYFKSAIAFQ